jgi:hypothetical protein
MKTHKDFFFFLGGSIERDGEREPLNVKTLTFFFLDFVEPEGNWVRNAKRPELEIGQVKREIYALVVCVCVCVCVCECVIKTCQPRHATVMFFAHQTAIF